MLTKNQKFSKMGIAIMIAAIVLITFVDTAETKDKDDKKKDWIDRGREIKDKGLSKWKKVKKDLASSTENGEKDEQEGMWLKVLVVVVGLSISCACCYFCYCKYCRSDASPPPSTIKAAPPHGISGAIARGAV